MSDLLRFDQSEEISVVAKLPQPAVYVGAVVLPDVVGPWTMVVADVIVLRCRDKLGFSAGGKHAGDDEYVNHVAADEGASIGGRLKPFLSMYDVRRQRDHVCAQSSEV